MGEYEAIYHRGSREPSIRKTCCWRKQVLEGSEGSEMELVFQQELGKGGRRRERGG